MAQRRRQRDRARAHQDRRHCDGGRRPRTRAHRHRCRRLQTAIRSKIRRRGDPAGVRGVLTRDSGYTPAPRNHAGSGALSKRGESRSLGDSPEMPATIHSLGIVGLGKMGADLAKNALAHGFTVAGTDTRAVPDDLTRAGLKAAKDLKQLAALLPQPRFVMIYVPAGPPVDQVLAQLADILQPGDIIADGGNSYWGDSIRRHARLKQKGINFIDAGTSGGPSGALKGACFMVGGDDAAIAADHEAGAFE